MKKFGFFIAFVVIAVLGVLAGLSCDNLTGTSISYSGERIGLIHVEGVITASKEGISSAYLQTGTSSETIVKQLDQAIKDANIKAVVIRVNSPGGSAAGSQEIFDAVKRVKAKGKKVVVSMGDVAASGGYFISAPADIIYANPSTLTGSIGVIAQLLNYEGLFEKIGLSETTLKAGKFKDIGSPTRAMTDEEKQIIQGLLTDTHQQFKEAVMEGRKMTAVDIEKLATGEIWTGRQAKEKRLVDELGGLKDALDRAAKEGGLNPEEYVVSPLGEENILDQILKGFKMDSSQIGVPDSLQTFARFLYMNPIAAGLVLR